MELLTRLFRALLEFILGSQTQKAFPELEKTKENRWVITQKEFEKEEDPNHIICNGVPVEIDWHKVVLWTEEGGLKCEPKQYRKRTKARRPKMFVVHWDACLSSRAMAKVLKQRGLSVAFAIDNDGTIYQLMDTKHIAWHAKGINTQSVGVEIANAVELKYQKWYEKHGFGPRPIVKGVELNGKKLPDMLGFYPVQIEALKALIKAVSVGLIIPLKVPTDKEGNLVMGVDKRVAGRSFKGIVGHYHVTQAKADPAGLALDKIVEEVVEGK